MATCSETSLLAAPAARNTVPLKSQRDLPIAAVDFGTTFCSLAYSLSDADTVKLVDLNPMKVRVPTALLLKHSPNGTLCTCEFGFDAQTSVTTLVGEERKTHLYFELVKMLLHNHDTVSRDTDLLHVHN